MKIEKIELKNFRNYENLSLNLKSKFNIFKGNNAQGKTNFLESIYFASIGKSPKNAKEKELITWNKEESSIFVIVKKKYFTQEIKIILSTKNKKIIKINGLNIRKIGDLIGEMPVVYFAPDEIGLIKDGPSDRRRFMDIDISQINKNYFYLLCRYEKVLEERNKLLKETKNFQNLLDTIDLWDTQLAEIASKIIYCRLQFVDKIKEPAKKVHANITSNKEELNIKYQGIQLKNIDEIKEKLLKSYRLNLKRDFDFGFTTIGPHRDDIEITINGIDVRNFGSQGQQRLATLSLKVAELALFEEKTGEKPILLLDDVLSELDGKRCKNFLNEIKDYQTIITTTKYNREIDDESVIFLVKDAKIKEAKKTKKDNKKL